MRVGIKLLIFMFCLFLAPAISQSKNILVGENEDVTSIAEAVDRAVDGDRISVASGVYREHSILVDKSILIIAEKGAVVDADSSAANIFLIKADDVMIEGFELRNVGVSFLKEIAAVKVSECSGARVLNNRIVNCFFGIYLENTVLASIMNNKIISEFDDEASAGNAIHAWKCKELSIRGNESRGHRDGIYFEFVDDSIIENNKSIGNLRYGLHFMFSNRDAYRSNLFRDNGAGVAVMFSKNIEMSRNHFDHNWGGASYGLLLKEISDGEITHNLFSKNTIGILAEGANRLLIAENEFVNNGTAVDMKGNSLDNEILRNNFIANTFEIVTNSKQNRNIYEANYWSGYRGYDLDRNGFGDVPYRPVNLFAKITDEIPSATIMLHSNFVNLLEAGEKTFPQMIPEELVDEKPRMKPYEYD
ncbi:nitrous oxide reductase family maturation protein NosD [Halocola ammonii]